MVSVNIPQPLLECERCQNSYHPSCLGPNYPKPNKRKKTWVSQILKMLKWRFLNLDCALCSVCFIVISSVSVKKCCYSIGWIFRAIHVQFMEVEGDCLTICVCQVCMSCIRCRSCGVTPGKSWDTEWNHDKGLCPDCTKLYGQGKIICSSFTLFHHFP